MSLQHRNIETLYDRIANEAHDTAYQQYTERLKSEKADQVIFADMFNRIYGEMIVRECSKVAREYTLKSSGIQNPYTGAVFIENEINRHFEV